MQVKPIPREQVGLRPAAARDSQNGYLAFIHCGSQLVASEDQERLECRMADRFFPSENG
jgi:hypothetical protein